MDEEQAEANFAYDQEIENLSDGKTSSYLDVHTQDSDILV